MADVYVLFGDKNKDLPILTYYEHNKELFTRKNQEGYGVFKAVNAFEATGEQMIDAGVKTMRNIQFLHEIRYAFGDLDIAKAGDNTPPEEKQRRKDALKAALLAKLPPTFIIDTANGLQPLWKFSECAIDKETQDKYVASINSLIEWSKGQGAAGDAVKDVTRVLRVPGYYHMKEEPYLCTFCHKSDKVYLPEEFYAAFPPTEKRNVVPHQVSNTDSLVFRELDRIPIADIVVKALAKNGETGEFDKQGRLIRNGRLTGNFIGKKGDRDYMASTSHEPIDGNRITSVAKILDTDNAGAMSFLKRAYGIDDEKLKKQDKIAKVLASVKPPSIREINKRKLYTWGTDGLIDNITAIERGNYVVLVGESNSGKTTFTFFVARQNAARGHKVVYLSLEMDSEAIYNNLAQRAAKIERRELNRGEIPEHKMEKYEEKMTELRNIKNLVMDGMNGAEGTTWDVVMAKMNMYPDADLFIIDNLGMIEKEGNEPENDMQKRVSINIKNYANRTGIPIILIHHLRKSSGDMKGDGARPMDAIMGSAKIVHNADTVVQVQRFVGDDVNEDDKKKFIVCVQKSRVGDPSSYTVYYENGEFVDRMSTKDIEFMFNNNYYEPSSEL